MSHDPAHAHDHKGDARAAFMGLIGGAIALLALVLVVVHLTNKKFEGHAPAGAAPAAESTKAH